MPAAVVTSVNVIDGPGACAEARSSGQATAATAATAVAQRNLASIRIGRYVSRRRLAARNRGGEHHAAVPAELLEADFGREVGFGDAALDRLECAPRRLCRRRLGHLREDRRGLRGGQLLPGHAVRLAGLALEGADRLDDALLRVGRLDGD